MMLDSTISQHFYNLYEPSCGRTHLHRIQPRLQVKVIFRYLRPDAPISLLFRLFT